MPSDTLLASVLKTLRPASEAWRSAVVATEEEIRGLLGTPTGPAGTAHSLGAFAAGRIDFERFTGVVTRTRAIEDGALVRLRVAYDTLVSLAARDPATLHCASAAEDGAGAAAGRVLAELGRAFGAAHEAVAARSGAWREAEHATLHQSYPFARWTRRERRLAPPVVLTVDGARLDASELAPYVDGSVKIVLVVEGPCTPAPLVRLVTPGTFVAQVADAAGLARFAAHPGPGVAAIVPECAALFVHDPAAGRAPWDRVRVDRMPQESAKRAVGAWSPDQQAEELRQLAALAMRPSAAAVVSAASALAASEAAAAESDPAGRLAAWLLEASGAGAA